MIRKAFVMQINLEAHEEYKKRHNPIWSELADTLKTHGVHEYSIFLDEKRHLLFASLRIESEARFAEIAQTQICQKWWQYMKTLMKTNADGSPISEELAEVFYLP